MTVEIWSDVMCPFCYIGKRKFEAGMAMFENRDDIEIIWKSFQLSPDLITDTTMGIHQYLATHKGISPDHAKRMNDQVTEAALREGLVYNFDKAVVANSFNAHRFSHFAKAAGKQHEAEEILFRSYFTDGKNIDDYPTLLSLGAAIGLDKDELSKALDNGDFGDEVHADVEEAQSLGVRGVPFFVFNRRYAISGAQESKSFLQALKQSFGEWEAEQITG
jgi:predicted DsbA family dithiol-disulfide isomerase